MQREHFEPNPAVTVPVAVALPAGVAGAAPTTASVPTAPTTVPVPMPLAAAAPFHTYVYFSLTRNRYVLKRVREAEDIKFATRLEKRQAKKEEEEEEEEGKGGFGGQKDEERIPLGPQRNPTSYTNASRSPPSRARARSSSRGSSKSERKENNQQRPLSRAEKLALDDELMAKEDAADKYREHGIDIQSPF